MPAGGLIRGELSLSSPVFKRFPTDSKFFGCFRDGKQALKKLCHAHNVSNTWQYFAVLAVLGDGECFREMFGNENVRFRTYATG